MSPVAFIAIALGVAAVCIVAVGHLTRKSDDWCESLPDRSGDYPAIPEALIDKARAEAMRRFYEQQNGPVKS